MEKKLSIPKVSKSKLLNAKEKMKTCGAKLKTISVAVKETKKIKYLPV